MRTLLLGLLMMTSLVLYAQNCTSRRYIDPIFPNITKYSNLVFANDVPNIGTVYVSETVTTNINLTMDVYVPTGDTLTKRPLLILAYGGGFIFGSKEDADINSVCDSLAHRGYVTATINYRMGLNLTDESGMERATYRATQDYSAAVRYLKHYSGQYGIDTNLVFIGGVSAGGIAALHLAYMDESDRPQSTYAAGGLTPRPDLGCKDCEGNPYTNSSKVTGVINYWGAILDTNMIKPTNALPTLLFHGVDDLIVPYDEGAPFSASLVAPSVNGSLYMSERMDNLGIYNEANIFPGVGHNIWGICVLNQWTTGPTQYYDTIWRSTRDFLYKMIRPATPILNAKQTICKQVDLHIDVAQSHPGASYCWEAPGSNGIPASANGPSVQLNWDSAGTYPVIVKEISVNQVVSDPDTFWVTVTDLPQYNVTATSPVCPGDSTLLHASGGFMFDWIGPGVAHIGQQSTMALPNESEWYGVFIVDTNECSLLDSVFVEVYDTTAPTITQSNDTLFTDLVDDINWYLAGQRLPTTQPWITPLADGTFWVESTDSNGCALRSADLQFTTTGVSPPGNAGINIYPNPVQDVLHIELNGSGQFRLYNLQGQLMLDQTLSGKTDLHLNNLPKGLYTYGILLGDQLRFGKLLH